jgi:hypothetical protein
MSCNGQLFFMIMWFGHDNQTLPLIDILPLHKWHLEAQDDLLALRNPLKEDHVATPSIPCAPLEKTYMVSYRMVTKPHHALDMFGAQQEAYEMLDFLCQWFSIRSHFKVITHLIAISKRLFIISYTSFHTGTCLASDTFWSKHKA